MNDEMYKFELRPYLSATYLMITQQHSPPATDVRLKNREHDVM